MKYDKGKKIFYDNFGSRYFMLRNGELSEYQKCDIKKNDEEMWKHEILGDIICEIISGQDIGLIWNLSRMDITQEQKMSAYYEIKEKGDTKKLKKEILSLKSLFEETEFLRLMKIFD